MPTQPVSAAGSGPAFRFRLREATREAHQRLDARLETLDLQHAIAREAFSRMQYRGLLRLSRACGGQAAEATPLLHRTTEALARDFPTDIVREIDAPLDADAVAYVALGSQLGLTALRRGLAPGDRTGIFAREPEIGGWQAFTARLAARPPDEPAARRILADALRAFAIFHDEACRLTALPLPAAPPSGAAERTARHRVS